MFRCEGLHWHLKDYGGGRAYLERPLFYNVQLGERLAPQLRAAPQGGYFVSCLCMLHQLNKLKCANKFILETVKNGAESKICAWSACHIHGAWNYGIYLHRLFTLICCQRVWRPSCRLIFPFSSLHMTQWYDPDDNTQGKIAWVCLPTGFIWLTFWLLIPVISECSVYEHVVKADLSKLWGPRILFRCIRGLQSCLAFTAATSGAVCAFWCRKANNWIFLVIAHACRELCIP